MKVYFKLLESCAVHRSRKTGVLIYFAGAGACSPPVKLSKQLFVPQTTTARELMYDNYACMVF